MEERKSVWDVNVFNRTTSKGKILSPDVYNFVIGLTLVWGFLVNWLIVKFVPTGFIENISPPVFLLFYFASCMGGVYMFNKSASPLISFAGYNLVAVPFGFVVNIVVARYNSDVVLDAIRITFIVTAIMMLMGTFYPRFFQKIYNVLTVTLTIVIIVELFDLYFLGIEHGIIDWIVVVIFCGYIGYDWGRANNIPKTLDNAVDSAAALYMDIINLFLRLLRILGRRK